MRKPFIGGNWKMFLDKKRAVDLAKALVKGTRDAAGKDILVCPAFPLLSDVAGVIKGKGIHLGAQNMYNEKEGAFTGEVSADMLLSVSCTHVLIGHSERRHIFHEGNDLLNKKVLSALQSGLKPVLCVGELLEERERGKTESVVQEQITAGLNGVKADHFTEIVIAYEPVWAIGTGKTATPDDADAVHAYIRRKVKGMYGDKISDELRIIYGGSVKPNNIDGLMVMDNIDGALVGGASLKPESFLRIINYSPRINYKKS